MKKYLIILIEVSIKKLYFILHKINKKSETDTFYSSLSPIYKGANEDSYSKALEWALSNKREKDIRNIALTGPYGSGKSTILKTFQKNYIGKDLKFLNISLATFKEEIDNEGNKESSSKNKAELLKQIEISILEQIFYHEEDEKVPDSRFKKIKSYTNKTLITYSIWYLLLILSISNFIYPTLIKKIFKDFVISNNINNAIHYTSVMIIFVGIVFLIYKSIRIISSLAFNKLNIQNIEIGIGDNLNKSVLNHHIDELIYFFSVRPYNVVIIEDLDRFRETEIFTKLREINLLLNNSERTRRKEIVFIYAIRDEMFADKERTKFFDFIIPVIPVINSSNSSEIIKKNNDLHKYNISEILIEQVSFFIDDMRLLNNINNEYYLYRDNLDRNLNQDKLFAIITYKNIYPKDFVNLTYNKGLLYGLINSKHAYVRKRTDEINREIKLCLDEISNLENILLKDIRELRYIYIANTINALGNFSNFSISSNKLNIDDMLTDENFMYLQKDKMEFDFHYKPNYNNYYYESREPVSSKIKFKTTENKINQNKSYGQRSKEIESLNNNKINSLRVKIKDFEIQKIKTRSLSLLELLQHDEIENEIRKDIDSFSNNELIYILIRNGYIDEDYLYYISLFHEQSITRTDYQFLLNVNSSIASEFDLKLNKIDKLLPKINTRAFETKLVFNYDLLDYVITHQDNCQEYIHIFIDKIVDESIESGEFLQKFVQYTKNINIFIELITKKWNNIWNFLSSDPRFSEEDRKIFYSYIITYSDEKTIIKIAEVSRFKEAILSDENFLNINENINKIKYVVKQLNIKFSIEALKNSSDILLKFILSDNHYRINIDNYKYLIAKFGQLDEIAFFQANYRAVLHSSVNSIIEYTNNNINEYIENIYLMLDNNNNELEDKYLLLINNENLEYAHKLDLIENTNTKIRNIQSVSDVDLYEEFLLQNKIIPDWHNLIVIYKNIDSGNSERLNAIITFISNNQNAKALSLVKTPTEDEYSDLYKRLWKFILTNIEIPNESYELIIKACPWWYEDLDISKLSFDKVSIMVNGIIMKPSPKSYNALQERFQPLNLIFLKKYKSKFIDNLNELSVDNTDIVHILKSNILSIDDKIIFIQLANSNVTLDASSLQLISNFILDHSVINLKESIYIDIIFDKHVDANNRIALFLLKSKMFDINLIIDFLNKLGGNYAEINNRSKKIKIEYNELNENLLKLLIDKEYISSYTKINSQLQVNHKKK